MVHPEPSTSSSRLPAEAAQRRLLHDEIHARPVLPLQPPALITQVAVLNQSITRQDEYKHVLELARTFDQVVEPEGTLMDIKFPGFTLRWERHREFSLYVITQPVDPECMWDVPDPDLLSLVSCPASWLAAIPGQTLVALQVLVMEAERDDPGILPHAQRILGSERVLGSRVRDGSAQIFTTYQLRPDGTSRFLVSLDGSSTDRAGFTASRLADLETYRTLALIGFPVAREMQNRLAAVENRLADLTRAIDEGTSDDSILLHELMELAAELDTDSATYASRFAATRAYYGIVQRRIEDLRGSAAPGLTGVFTYLNRRLIPAMATVKATSERLTAASAHLGRSADLLRTRVDITAEVQNTELLRSLTKGQRMQLRLQETVEGLSIVAISYYVLGVVGYAAKGLKATGLGWDVNVVVGAAIPAVLIGVWWMLRRSARHRSGADD